MARENPTWGQARVADELSLKLGILLSPRTAWKRFSVGPSFCAPQVFIFRIHLRSIKADSSTVRFAPPQWLDYGAPTYVGKIQPRLAAVTISALASTLGVSEPCGAHIRAGGHRRHLSH